MITDRCQRITFDEDSHTYHVDGEKISTSVTKFIHSFFSEFNAEEIINKYYSYWQKNNHKQYGGLSKEEILGVWDKERDLGTEFHAAIEDYYNLLLNKVSYKFWIPNRIKKEWFQFLQFDEQKGDLMPYRTEMRVWSKELDLAGSIDMLFKKSNGKFAIYDWKRTKRIERNGYDRGKYPLNDIIDTNFWHYSLQLNMYKFLLEKYYDMEIEEMCLVQMHPNLDGYQVYECPDLQEVIIKMLKWKKLLK